MEAMSISFRNIVCLGSIVRIKHLNSKIIFALHELLCIPTVTTLPSHCFGDTEIEVLDRR